VFSFSLKFHIIHVQCSMTSPHTHTHTHTHTNNCSIIRHDDIQTGDNPPTCFGPFSAILREEEQYVNIINVECLPEDY
jgi:hypothetical protein